MSSYVRPSVPLTSGRSTPWSIPVLAPFAPGNVPNRLSKVRFSLIRKITCLIGQRVSKAAASTTDGRGPPPVLAGGETDDTGDAEPGAGGTPGSGSDEVQATATSAVIDRVSRARRMGAAKSTGPPRSVRVGQDVGQERSERRRQRLHRFEAEMFGVHAGQRRCGGARRRQRQLGRRLRADLARQGRDLLQR